MEKRKRDIFALCAGMSGPRVPQGRLGVTSLLPQRHDCHVWPASTPGSPRCYITSASALSCLARVRCRVASVLHHFCLSVMHVYQLKPSPNRYHRLSCLARVCRRVASVLHHFCLSSPRCYITSA
ncbi:hypothetical protein J6590_068504 [Homalodisca vitripennis]|nr:hypothetical protein J6590_068504 [Homalodisca vitripennis]